MEWCWMTLAIIGVWLAEALNTAIEFLTDLVSPEFHPLAGKAKDVAAGAVLIAAIGAGVIGMFVFGPHLLRMTRTPDCRSASPTRTSAFRV
jgi:diacylglycerol kinase (ATP)